jgi:hypothetical protein
MWIILFKNFLPFSASLLSTHYNLDELLLHVGGRQL